MARQLYDLGIDGGHIWVGGEAMKEADVKDVVTVEAYDDEQMAGLFADYEFGVSLFGAFGPIVRDDDDVYASSSGLTPVQELARTLGFADCN